MRYDYSAKLKSGIIEQSRAGIKRNCFSELAAKLDKGYPSPSHGEPWTQSILDSAGAPWTPYHRQPRICEDIFLGLCCRAGWIWEFQAKQPGIFKHGEP